MNYRTVIHVVSMLVIIVGIAMLTAVIVAFCCDRNQPTPMRFLYCTLGTLAIGWTGYQTTHRLPGEQILEGGPQTGFACVTFGWLFATLFGALPFFFCSHIRFYDALFEAASGLTTTGATIMSRNMELLRGEHLPNGLEDLPVSILYWRSVLNWLGGLGIVFFVLIILPKLKLISGRQLYDAEVSGLNIDGNQLTPRLASSVKYILGIYLLLSLLCTGCYLAGGMSFFDAVCHSFSTVSTSGFSTKNNSFSDFPNPFIQWSATLFMFLSACNFTLLVRLVFFKRFEFWRDEEFRLYAIVAVGSILLIAAYLYCIRPDGLPGINGKSPIPHGIEEYLRATAFQVVSLMSTTGFATSDYLLWYTPAVMVWLAMLMFPCGCGGSTSGGTKYSRLIITLKMLLYELKYSLTPRITPDVRLNGQHIEKSLVAKTISFFIFYVLIVFGSTFLLSLTENIRFDTAFGASISCLSNVGPGFGKVGPAGDYSFLTASGKGWLVLIMILGRLELYTVLVLFLPSFWKK